ncbi:hypothetical protein M9H77_30928 [Catharanthus roseus]|uniref:Uncharacterized protein n=1 Tax=Catharanthus roseus TaxID=4058 RepID=A0ACB9ZZ11_CATRO|nr:hypothetical protein M9H77_30928 [Catharanthus roseus]
MSNSVMFDPSSYGFDNLDDTFLVELHIVGFALEFDRNSPTSLHHNINKRKETYHAVRRQRQKCWRKTNLMLWRFDNEFFFKLVLLLPYFFLQRVKIALRFECLLCDFCGKLPFYLWNSYGDKTLVDKLYALFAYSLLSLECLGTVKLFQGPVTRVMARRMEEEHQGKIAIFKEIIQDLGWQVIGVQQQDFRRSKTFLLSSVQAEESKEARLGNLEA